MIAEYLSGKQIKLSPAAFRTLLVSHTMENYWTRPPDSTEHRLISGGWIVQQSTTTAYPKISGTFVDVTSWRTCWAGGGCHLNTKERQWILQPIAGTNRVSGRCADRASYSTPESQEEVGWSGSSASGTVQPDGGLVLSCVHFSWQPLRGRYYEDAQKGYLKFEHGTFRSLGSLGSVRKAGGLTTTVLKPEEGIFVGAATGQKVTVTWYSYAWSPQFEAQLQGSDNARYLVLGGYGVGDVTNLRLDTDTRASANFSWKVLLNSNGKVLYGVNPVPGQAGTGTALFAKKPDQTWFLESVSNVVGLPN